MRVKSLLRQWNLRPDNALGQNFLVDPTILQRIAEAAELTIDDVVLEIGAGTGALTRLLASEAKHVVAVELDRRLMPLLERELSDLDNVTAIQGDILSLDPSSLIDAVLPNAGLSQANYRVVGNLPYYITSAILRHVLERDRRPELMVITVQYEVAERIVAEPGDMSVLAASVQFYGEPELLFKIDSASFYPSPAVDSGVVRLDVHTSPRLPDDQIDTFFRVVRAGFSQRRKQLHNALSTGLADQLSRDEAIERLHQADVDHRRRAETLSIDEWVKITDALQDVLGPS